MDFASYSPYISRMKTKTPYEILVAKFLEKLPSGLDQNQCWEWQGSIFNNGYGDFVVGTRGNPNHYRERPHRFAFMHYNQAKIPKDKMVCHRCDNPKCCNPHHLFLGSSKDNARDCLEKGRWVRREISVATGKRVARKLKHNKFGQWMKPGDNPNIRKGRKMSSKEVSAMMKKIAPKGENHYRSKFTAAQIEEVFRLRSKGISYREIGAQFGVGATCIYKIIKRKRWKSAGSD
jgi:hypothetical protein